MSQTSGFPKPRHLMNKTYWDSRRDTEGRKKKISKLEERVFVELLMLPGSGNF